MLCLSWPFIVYVNVEDLNLQRRYKYLGTRYFVLVDATSGTR